MDKHFDGVKAQQSLREHAHKNGWTTWRFEAAGDYLIAYAKKGENPPLNMRVDDVKVVHDIVDAAKVNP